MHTATFVCALAILASLCLQAQSNCLIYGDDLTVGVHYRNCSKIECLENGDIHGVGCPPSECPSGKPSGFKEADSSKPYPECCERPICDKS